MYKRLRLLIGLLLLSVVLAIIKPIRSAQYSHSSMVNNSQSSISRDTHSSNTNKIKTIKLTTSEDYTSPQYIEYNGKKVIDWNQPTGAHPDLSNYNANQLLIKVNQDKQRLFIYNKETHQVLAEFIVSTGEKGFATPNGHFHIQQEHGTWFYNNKPNIQEGAKNYVSFLQHGVYLFHSIPYNENQQPIAKRMGKLGQKNSHGCIQLSVPDSEWFYNTFTQPNKIGTEVVISNN